MQHLSLYDQGLCDWNVDFRWFVKKTVADCLQTRPIDHRHRLVKIRGQLASHKVQEISQTLLFLNLMYSCKTPKGRDGGIHRGNPAFGYYFYSCSA